MKSSSLNKTNFDDAENGFLWSIYQASYDSMAVLEPDPRVKDWFLMSSAWPTLYISLAYVFIVKIWGPWFMRKRPAYDLRVMLIIYNGCQVIFSLWLFKRCLRIGWFIKYSWTCEPVDYSNSEHSIDVAITCWYYFISKFTEFFDTFFFVLRKKNAHISFLHTFHHSLLPIGSWVLVKYVAGGQTTFGGAMNVGVHVIMYFYYLVAALGPRYEKLIWWKKYLTVIQMIQFTLAGCHMGQIIFIHECNYPKPFAWLIFFNAFVFFGLFFNFYIQAYKKNRRLQKQKSKINQEMTEGGVQKIEISDKQEHLNEKKLKYG